MATVTLGGKTVNLRGKFPVAGQTTMDFELVKGDLGTAYYEWAGFDPAD